MQGSYGIYVTGVDTSGNPKFLDGVVHFDGNCGVTGTITIGEPTQNEQVSATVTGSYDRQSDETLTISLNLPNITEPETYVVAYSNVFGEALGEETDSTAISTIDLKPQTFPKPTTVRTYDNAVLKGRFTASCFGAAGYSDLNFFSFDGTTDGNGFGNITNGVDDSNNYAAFFDQPYTGNYKVNPDGTFSGTVTVGSYPYSYTGVIDNDGNEIQFVYTKLYTNIAYVGCTGKRVAKP